LLDQRLVVAITFAPATDKIGIGAGCELVHAIGLALARPALGSDWLNSPSDPMQDVGVMGFNDKRRSQGSDRI
jgi:hypothetical protein